MALAPALLVFAGGLALAAFAYVPMRRDLRSLGRQFGIRGRVGWGCYTLAVAGVASVAALRGTLPPNDFLTAGLWALYFPGWLGLAYAAGNYPLYRRLRAANRPATGAITPDDGLVAVSGEVTPVEGPATTPLLDEPAVCHTWTVEKYGWVPRRGWSTVALGQGCVPFDLDDGSGPVRVEPAGAELRPVGVDTRQVDAEESLPAHAVAFLEGAADFDPTGTTHRYEERRLEPGETAYALGHPNSGGDGEVATLAAADGSLLVGSGEVETVTRRLGRVVRVAGAGGAVAVGLGYVGMVLAAGAVPL